MLPQKDIGAFDFQPMHNAVYFKDMMIVQVISLPDSQGATFHIIHVLLKLTIQMYHF